MKRFSIFLFFLLECGEESLKEPQRFYVVFGVICPEFSRQQVVFDSSYSVTEPVEDTAGIRDAEVYLISLGDTIRLYDSEETPGIYSTEKKIEHGKSYTLEIFYKDSLILEEKTEVPGKFKIKEPSWGDTVYLSSPSSVVWTKASGCYRNTYIIWAEVLGSNEAFANLASEDTSSNIFNFRPLFPEKDTLYLIYVEGFDENGYSWARGNEDVIDEEDVVGVFYSVTKDSVLVYVK